MTLGRSIKRGLVSLLAVGALAGAISGCQPNNNPITTPPPTTPPPTGTTPAEYAQQDGLNTAIDVTTPILKFHPYVNTEDMDAIDWLSQIQNTTYFQNNNGIEFANAFLTRFYNLDDLKLDELLATEDYYNQAKAANGPLNIKFVNGIKWPLPPEFAPPDMASDPTVIGLRASPALVSIQYLDLNANNIGQSGYKPITWFTKVDPTLTECNNATEYLKQNASMSMLFDPTYIQNKYGNNAPVTSPAYANMTIIQNTVYQYAGQFPDGSIAIKYIPGKDLINAPYLIFSINHILGKNDETNTAKWPYQVGSHPTKDAILAYLNTHVAGYIGFDAIDMPVWTSSLGFDGITLTRQPGVKRLTLFWYDKSLDAAHQANFNLYSLWRNDGSTLDGGNNLPASQTCGYDSNGNPLP